MAFLKRIAMILAVVSLLAAPNARAQGPAELKLYEREIKAGLLYNFLKYTQWPAGDGPISVCLYGGDPFGGYLSRTEGRTVNQRTITVREVGSVNETASCSLLVVSASERSNWPQIASYLSGKPVLTVGDFGGFASAGGMIEFGRAGDHISVSMNMQAVKSANLRVGDRLLKLVTVVHGKG
jgi:hypothetical protein